MLLLPGTAGTAEELAGLAGRMADHFHVLRLALPGAGDARAWADDLPALTVDAVAAAIADHVTALGLRPRAVVGHSAGGAVAAEVAHALPDVVDALVLLDTNLPPDPGAQPGRIERLTRLRGLGQDALRAAFTTSMRASWGDRCVGSAAHRLVMEGIDGAHDRVIGEFWLSMLGVAPAAVWRGLAVPTLYVRSDRPVTAEAVRRLTPRVSHVDLSDGGAGHWVHLVELDRVADLVLGHLTRTLRPGEVRHWDDVRHETGPASRRCPPLPGL